MLNTSEASKVESTMTCLSYQIYETWKAQKYTQEKVSNALSNKNSEMLFFIHNSDPNTATYNQYSVDYRLLTSMSFLVPFHQMDSLTFFFFLRICLDGILCILLFKTIFLYVCLAAFFIMQQNSDKMSLIILKYENDRFI